MFTLTSVAKKDLLHNKAYYVKKGFIYFTRIEINKNEIALYNGTKKIVEFKNKLSSLQFDRGDTITFVLCEGKMKMALE